MYVGRPLASSLRPSTQSFPLSLSQSTSISLSPRSFAFPPLATVHRAGGMSGLNVRVASTAPDRRAVPLMTCRTRAEHNNTAHGRTCVYTRTLWPSPVWWAGRGTVRGERPEKKVVYPIKITGQNRWEKGLAIIVVKNICLFFRVGTSYRTDPDPS